MVAVFYPAKKPPRTRGKRTNPTRPAQEMLNTVNSEIKLEMLINENFGRLDYAMHASYSNAFLPETVEEVDRDRKNYIRRLQRVYDKAGVEFKWIAVIEHGSNGRWHLHMLVSGGVPREVLESKWGMGYCNADRLQFSERGLKGLQHYIVKERVMYKRWSASRNLKKPPPKKERPVSRISFQKLWDAVDDRDTWESRYKDYFFVEAQKMENPDFGERYIRVRMCRKDAKLDFVDDCYYRGYPPPRRRAKRKNE